MIVFANQSKTLKRELCPVSETDAPRANPASMGKLCTMKIFYCTFHDGTNGTRSIHKPGKNGELIELLDVGRPINTLCLELLQEQ